jgi:hypothetical protein
LRKVKDSLKDEASWFTDSDSDWFEARDMIGQTMLKRGNSVAMQGYNSNKVGDGGGWWWW